MEDKVGGRLLVGKWGDISRSRCAGPMLRFVMFQRASLGLRGPFVCSFWWTGGVGAQLTV